MEKKASNIEAILLPTLPKTMEITATYYLHKHLHLHTFQTVANAISFLVSMAIAERTQLNSTSYNHTTGTLPWCCLAENCFSR